MESASWFEEMKRRRVFRTLVGYGIVAFAVLQVAEPVMHGLNLPEWVLSATVVGLGIGFAFAIVLAWALDVRGGRIERTAPTPSRRLVLLLVVIGLAIGAPGVGWYFWKAHRTAAARADRASIAVSMPEEEPEVGIVEPRTAGLKGEINEGRRSNPCHPLTKVVASQGMTRCLGG